MPDDLVARGREQRLLNDVSGFEEAVPLLREAIENDPTNAAAYAELSETYSAWGLRRERSCLGLQWESRMLEFQSLYDLAFDYAQTALRLDPESGATHRAMAAALRHGTKADPERRLREAHLAENLSPDDPECACERWRAEGYDPDDETPRKALAAQPKLTAVRVDLADSLRDRGRYAEALTEMETALKLNPTNVLVYYEIAMLLRRKGLREKALEILGHAKRLRPEDPLVKRGFVLLGESYEYQHR